MCVYMFAYVYIFVYIYMHTHVCICQTNIYRPTHMYIYYVYEHASMHTHNDSYHACINLFAAFTCSYRASDVDGIIACVPIYT